MKQYVCTICGFVYDEAAGIPDMGIAPGTKWEELPENWTCPMCGAAKSEFRELKAEPKMDAPKMDAPVNQPPMEQEELRELSARETSALLSNLSKGCEKQYRQEEAALLTSLSNHFKQAAGKEPETDFESLLELINADLENGFPEANRQAKEEPDRGALRALVWSEKVTRILKSLLTRYETEGERMLENTGVFVCSICGFVFVGNTPPEICPVCKVPSWKFVKLEER